MIPEKDLAELRKRFAGFTSTVRRNLPFLKNEADVCKSLIDPLLMKIDWRPSDAARVIREHEIPLIRGRADYALLGKPVDFSAGTLGNPLIIIEAKQKGALAEDHIPPDQLSKYVNMLNTCFVGAWTNGSTWCWFCKDFKHVLNPKPFLEFDVTQKNWLTQPVLEWLALLRQQYYNPDPAELLRISKRQNLQTKLQTWWDSVKQAPSEGMLKFLWKELDIPKPNPSLSDLEDVKWAWGMLHGEDALPPPNGNGPPLPPPEGYAWCFKDRTTGQWSEWKARKFAVDVQADVAEWLIQWSYDGFEPLLEEPAKRTLTHFNGANPKKFWGRKLCDGRVHMHTNLTNDARVKWLKQLASRTKDSSGKPPVYGEDFELNLPRKNP